MCAMLNIYRRCFYGYVLFVLPPLSMDVVNTNGHSIDDMDKLCKGLNLILS